MGKGEWRGGNRGFGHHCFLSRAGCAGEYGAVITPNQCHHEKYLSSAKRCVRLGTSRRQSQFIGSPMRCQPTSALTVPDRCLLWDTLRHDDSAGSSAFLVGADHVVALLALAEAKHWPKPQAADPRPPCTRLTSLSSKRLSATD